MMNLGEGLLYESSKQNQKNLNFIWIKNLFISSN